MSVGTISTNEIHSVNPQGLLKIRGDISKSATRTKMCFKKVFCQTFACEHFPFEWGRSYWTSVDNIEFRPFSIPRVIISLQKGEWFKIKDTVASLLATKAVQRIVAILAVFEFSFNIKIHVDITVSPTTKTVPSCDSLGMLLSRLKKWKRTQSTTLSPCVTHSGMNWPCTWRTNSVGVCLLSPCYCSFLHCELADIFWNHRFVSRFISRDTKGQQFISLKTRKFRNLQQQTDSAFVKTLKSSSSMEGGWKNKLCPCPIFLTFYDVCFRTFWCFIRSFARSFVPLVRSIRLFHPFIPFVRWFRSFVHSFTPELVLCFRFTTKNKTCCRTQTFVVEGELWILELRRRPSSLLQVTCLRTAKRLWKGWIFNE